MRRPVIDIKFITANGDATMRITSKSRMMELVLVAATAGLTQGCATLIKGPSQSVPVSSDPPAADIFGLDDLIVMPHVQNGMGAVLFCQGGQPKCLETYTFGDELWDGLFEGFVIQKAT